MGVSEYYCWLDDPSAPRMNRASRQKTATQAASFADRPQTGRQKEDLRSTGRSRAYRSAMMVCPRFSAIQRKPI